MVVATPPPTPKQVTLPVSFSHGGAKPDSKTLLIFLYINPLRDFLFNREQGLYCLPNGEIICKWFNKKIAYLK